MFKSQASFKYICENCVDAYTHKWTYKGITGSYVFTLMAGDDLIYTY